MSLAVRTPAILTDHPFEAVARKGAVIGVGRVELRRRRDAIRVGEPLSALTPPLAVDAKEL